MSVNNSTKKLSITRTVFEDLDICGMNIIEIIKELQRLVDENPNEELVAHSSDSYAYSGVDIVLHRLETDKEYNERQKFVKDEARRKENQKRMNSLMKKDNLSTEEKEELIKYIQGK